MDFNGDRPIYIQLYEEFYRLIATGEWEAGEKVGSVRQLALDYGVNPNTVQKALQELDRAELTKSDRTRGRFVTEEEILIEKIRANSFLEACDQLIQMAQDLKMKPEIVFQLIEKRWNAREEDKNDTN